MSDEATGGEPDPLEGMRRAYSAAMKSWSDAVERVVGGEEFASAAGQLLSRYADFQHTVRDSAKATADSLHMPTKDDLAEIAGLLINVERKLDELIERVDSERGDGLDARLGRIEEKLDALAAAATPATKRARSTRAKRAGASGSSRSRRTASGSDGSGEE